MLFENYKNCLFNDKIMLKSQQRFKNYNHEVYTEEVNKIPLSSNDDKILQTFDKITSFPPRKNTFKACENEILNIRKAKEPLLRKECENEMYVTCNIFLKYIEIKCASEMRRYDKFRVKKCYVALQHIND